MLCRAIGGRELSLLCACLLVGAVAAAASPYFATWDNAAAVFRNSVELLFVSLGMTLLLAMGSIDVSAGTVMGLAAIVVGRVVQADGGVPLAIVAGPAAGLLLGLLNAAVVVFGRVPAIVATLGLFGVYRAAIFLALGGSWLSGLPPRLTAAIGGVPVALAAILATYALAWVALRRTSYGPHLLAVGHAEEKARLSGVAVARTRAIAFVASGLLCGLAATFYVAIYRNVETTTGGSLALEAIAAVVLGGTSILGGGCSLLGTAIGVALIRLLQNGLLLAGVPSLWQTVVTGALLLSVLTGEVLQGHLRAGVLDRRAARREA